MAAADVLNRDLYLRLLNSPKITLAVGTKSAHKLTIVPKGLLVYHSTFFANHFYEKDETEDNAVYHLRPTSRSTMTTFAQWCVNGKMCYFPEKVHLGDDETLRLRKARLLDIWRFAQHYDVRELENATLYLLVKLLGHHPEILNLTDMRKCFAGIEIYQPYSPFYILMTAVLIQRLEDPRTEITPVGYKVYAHIFSRGRCLALVNTLKVLWLAFEEQTGTGVKPTLASFLECDLIKEQLRWSRIMFPDDHVMELCGIKMQDRPLQGEARENELLTFREALADPEMDVPPGTAL